MPNVPSKTATRRFLDPDTRSDRPPATGRSALDPCVRHRDDRSSIDQGVERRHNASAAGNVGAVRQNWTDNLAVIRSHPGLAPPDVVAAITGRVDQYLEGHGELFTDRLRRGADP